MSTEKEKKYSHNEDFQKRMLQLMHQFSFSPSKENRRFNLLLEKFDVSYQTYHVLMMLLDKPEGVEPSRIADNFSILRQTVTNIADKMEQLGYLERIRSTTDRRSIYLRLLPEGVKQATAMREEIEAYHKRVMVNFSEQELETYFDFRRRLSACLDEELERTMAARASESK